MFAGASQDIRLFVISVSPSMKKKTLRGYAIVNKENRQAAYITDLTFENEEAGAELVSQIMVNLRKAGYPILNYFGNMSNPRGDRVFALLR